MAESKNKKKTTNTTKKKSTNKNTTVSKKTNNKNTKSVNKNSTPKKTAVPKKNITTKNTAVPKKNTTTKKTAVPKKNTTTKKTVSTKTVTSNKQTTSKKNEIKEVKKIEIKEKKKIININDILNAIKKPFVIVKNKIVNYFKSYDEKEIEEPKLISFKFLSKLIILLIVIGMFILLPRLNKKGNNSSLSVVNTESIPIFTYHRIVPKMYKQAKYFDDSDTISEKVFKEQMRYLYLNGYKTISIDEFYCWYQGKCKFDNKTVMITFDDGYQEDYFIALPILERYNFKATSFIVGIRVKDEKITKYDGNKKKYLSNNLIKDIKNNHKNLTLESHSYDMHFKKKDKPISKKYNYEENLNDFKKNEKFKFKYIAYPYGYTDGEVLKAVEKSKYKLGFLSDNKESATRKSDKYKIPRIEIDDKDTIDSFIKWLN